MKQALRADDVDGARQCVQTFLPRRVHRRYTRLRQVRGDENSVHAVAIAEKIIAEFEECRLEIDAGKGARGGRTVEQQLTQILTEAAAGIEIRGGRVGFQASQDRCIRRMLYGGQVEEAEVANAWIGPCFERSRSLYDAEREVSVYC